MLDIFSCSLVVVFGIDRVQRRRILTKERNAAAIKEANLRAQLAETENERKTKELEEARQLAAFNASKNTSAITAS